MTTPRPLFESGQRLSRLNRNVFLLWPSVSPDLNLIKDVWALFKSGLKEKTVTGVIDELFNVLVEKWDSIDTFPVIMSMRKRLLQVIDADRGHTKFIKIIFLIDVNHDFPYVVQCFE